MQNSGTGARLSGVAYGNGIFVAVGYFTILASSDGVSWTSLASRISYLLHGVAYGGGTFVAVGVGGVILLVFP